MTELKYCSEHSYVSLISEKGYHPIPFTRIKKGDIALISKHEGHRTTIVVNGDTVSVEYCVEVEPLEDVKIQNLKAGDVVIIPTRWDSDTHLIISGFVQGEVAVQKIDDLSQEYLIKPDCFVVKVPNIDSKTATRDNQNKPRLDLLLQFNLESLAIHMEEGEKKYPDVDSTPNWMLGGKPDHEYIASALRHLSKMKQGETHDLDDFGTFHAAAVAWNMLALITNNYKEMPNRVTPETSK